MEGLACKANRAEDRVGWGAAERAETNHAQNESWTMIDCSQVPADRSIVRLIWVYNVKAVEH
eukprot:3307872-Pleurochrysis_carterae.AAC.5